MKIEIERDRLRRLADWSAAIQRDLRGGRFWDLEHYADTLESLTGFMAEDLAGFASGADEAALDDAP